MRCVPAVKCRERAFLKTNKRITIQTVLHFFERRWMLCYVQFYISLINCFLSAQIDSNCVWREKTTQSNRRSALRQLRKTVEPLRRLRRSHASPSCHCLDWEFDERSGGTVKVDCKTRALCSPNLLSANIIKQNCKWPFCHANHRIDLCFAVGLVFLACFFSVCFGENTAKTYTYCSR